jgi:predicted ATPase
MYKRVPAAISTLMTAGDFAGFSETVADAIRREPERVRTVLRDVGRNIVLQPQDVGVGLSQIVPVLVALLDPGTDLVCLEQPELHLHPRQQASLGDALIKAIHDFPNRIMVVETHSEHLILRLLRRVRETTAAEAEPDTELRATQVAVAYVQPNSTNATVTSIALTDDGDFQQAWPNGFFAERAKELF